MYIVIFLVIDFIYMVIMSIYYNVNIEIDTIKKCYGCTDNFNFESTCKKIIYDDQQIIRVSNVLYFMCIPTIFVMVQLLFYEVNNTYKTNIAVRIIVSVVARLGIPSCFRYLLTILTQNLYKCECNNKMCLKSDMKYVDIMLYTISGLTFYSIYLSLNYFIADFKFDIYSAYVNLIKNNYSQKQNIILKLIKYILLLILGLIILYMTLSLIFTLFVMSFVISKNILDFNEKFILNTSLDSDKNIIMFVNELYNIIEFIIELIIIAKINKKNSFFDDRDAQYDIIQNA